jgi:hypothetical protein
MHPTLLFPGISWPLKAADEPGVTALITLKLDVALEPVEVHLGLGLKLLYRKVHPKGTIDDIAGVGCSVLQRLAVLKTRERGGICSQYGTGSR